MNTNEYDIKVIKVVDGDTVDVDIDLGFGVTLTDERVRIMGIDTPESRTSDRVEKLFGKAAGCAGFLAAAKLIQGIKQAAQASTFKDLWA